MKPPRVQDQTKSFERALAADAKPVHYRLRLFVSGTTSRSARAIQNIRTLCEERLYGRYDLEVIDIYQHPEQMKPEQILVTPTLVKKLPEPVRKIIGDLSDRQRVLVALELTSNKPRGRPGGGS